MVQHVAETMEPIVLVLLRSGSWGRPKQKCEGEWLTMWCEVELGRSEAFHPDNSIELFMSGANKQVVPFRSFIKFEASVEA